MSENSEPHAFTPDQAAEIIVAAINAGALKLPFVAAFNRQKFEECVQQYVRNDFSARPDEDVMRAAEAYGAAREMAAMARADALYLLTLRESLVNGLTQKKAELIRSTFRHM